jgi:hypothetical protein
MENDLKIISINSQNWKEHETILKDICSLSEKDTSPAAKNINWKDWQSNASSLMYKIAIKKRYDLPLGSFFILLKENKPIACSGCYLSPWSKSIMIIGSRTWTSNKLRKNWWHGNFLLPKQIELAKELNCKATVMTFNLYNLWLYKFIERLKQNKAVTLGYKPSNFYKDFVLSNDMYNINSTKQKIAIKLLDCTEQEFLNKYLPEKIT